MALHMAPKQPKDDGGVRKGPPKGGPQPKDTGGVRRRAPEKPQPGDDGGT